MKPTAGDDHNNIGTEWSRVLKISSRDEFEQSFAVAKLAINLCELEMSKRQTSLQKENLASRKVSGRSMAVDWEGAPACVESTNRRGVSRGAWWER